jgi:DnaA regulatory inactivator Hda
MSAVIQQIPLDLGHRPAHGLQDFLVAPSNQNAVSWIDRWPEWPGPAIVIYGPASCGKSHLAAVWKNKANAKYVKANHINEQQADEIARLGENLVIDRVDLLIGDRSAETTLFHLYNIFKEDNRFLMLTSRMPPAAAAFQIPDLASRLRAAPSVAIESPDDELLAALLVKLFSDRQLQIGCDAINYIVPRMERSFSAAYDLVKKADHLALSEKRPVSIPLLRRILLSSEP